MNNAFELSRTLVSAGVERKAADAIAEVVVTHFDENAATKSDIAELKGELRAVRVELKGEIRLLAERFNILLGMQAALLILFIADKFIQ